LSCVFDIIRLKGDETKMKKKTSCHVTQSFET
jgi:hypothetical protein